jgi:uncharacterized BrkB/YihY/UPF0761 family membrane protein
VIVVAVRCIVLGSAGQVLTAAVTQAHRVAAQHHYTPLLLGMIGALVTATTAMGQLERRFNRIYGVEQDRRSVKKYALAFFFALSVGTLLVLLAVINGVVAVPFLVVVMRISSSSNLMGTYVNGKLANVLGWLTAAIMSAAAIALFVTGGISL